MLTKARVIEILKEQYPYLVREYGIVRIGIFGSFASGTPKDTSDVDLVAEFSRPIGLRFMELTDYLEQQLGRKADVLTLAGLESVRNPRIAEAIQEGGVPAKLSYHAGTFLCNHIMYQVLHHVATEGLSILAGFIHVPPTPALVAATPESPSMRLEKIRVGTVLGLENLVSYLNNFRVESTAGQSQPGGSS